MLLIIRNTLALLALLACSSALWAAGPLWIDVRTADEYAQKHVAGAVNIPYEEIESRVGEVTTDKDALIYVYCRSGRRSGIAQGVLTESGYSNVINIGGLEDAERVSAGALKP